MDRFLENDLKLWFNSKNRKPLILRGARQVGKSTLVRNFADKNNLKLAELNLEKTPLSSILLSGYQIQKIIDEIELYFNFKLDDKNILVFFDEIQAQPKMITALRYFYENYPSIAVVSAGSLLELTLSQEEVSFPVGRIEMLYVNPMTYLEFLQAINLTAYEKTSQKKASEINSILHDKLIEYYEVFLVIGGMPEAVKKYIETESLLEVKNVHRSIINTYKLDFPKYGKSIQIDKLEMVFQSLPQIIGDKVMYSQINSDLRSRDIKKIIQLLKLTRLITVCNHSNGTTFPLSAQADESVQKLYFLDVGLYNSMMKTETSLLAKTVSVDDLIQGSLAEQFVAQHLVFLNTYGISQNLFYWLKDKKANKAEVDFLWENKNKIFPLEVKSSVSGKMKSLFHFMFEKKHQVGIQLSKSEFSTQKISQKISDGKKPVLVEFELIKFPIYLVEKIETIFELKKLY